MLAAGTPEGHGCPTTIRCLCLEDPSAFPLGQVPPCFQGGGAPGLGRGGKASAEGIWPGEGGGSGLRRWPFARQHGQRREEGCSVHPRPGLSTNPWWGARGQPPASLHLPLPPLAPGQYLAGVRGESALAAARTPPAPGLCINKGFCAGHGEGHGEAPHRVLQTQQGPHRSPFVSPRRPPTSQEEVIFFSRIVGGLAACHVAGGGPSAHSGGHPGGGLAE